MCMIAGGLGGIRAGEGCPPMGRKLPASRHNTRYQHQCHWYWHRTCRTRPYVVGRDHRRAIVHSSFVRSGLLPSDALNSTKDPLHHPHVQGTITHMDTCTRHAMAVHPGSPCLYCVLEANGAARILSLVQLMQVTRNIYHREENEYASQHTMHGI